MFSYPNLYFLYYSFFPDVGFCREVVEGGVESGQEAHLVVHPDHAVVQYLRNYSIVLVLFS